MHKYENLEFHETCPCCPESYVVTNSSGWTVGRVRLRWGDLTVEHIPSNKLVYSAQIGNEFTGYFESDEQRAKHLRLAAYALRQVIDKSKETT